MEVAVKIFSLCLETAVIVVDIWQNKILPSYNMSSVIYLINVYMQSFKLAMKNNYISDNE